MTFGILIRTSRPITWIPMAVAYMVGLYYGGFEISLLTVLMGVMFTLPMGLILYGINDIHDYKSDIMNKRKMGLQGSPLPPEHHRSIRIGWAVSSTALIAVSSLFLYRGNPLPVIMSLLLVAVSYAYSAPPLRLKGVPVLDFSANALMVTSMLLIGFLINGSVHSILPQLFAIGLVGGAAHILFASADLTSDLLSGIRTTSTEYGITGSSLIAAGIITVSWTIGNFTSSIIAANFFVAFIAAILIAYFNDEDKARIIVTSAAIYTLVSSVAYATTLV